MANIDKQDLFSIYSIAHTQFNVLFATGCDKNIQTYLSQIFIQTFLQINFLIPIYSNIPSCQIFLYRYIWTFICECVRVWKLFKYLNVFKHFFRYLFVSYFWYKYIRIFVRVNFLFECRQKFLRISHSGLPSCVRLLKGDSLCLPLCKRRKRLAVTLLLWKKIRRRDNNSLLVLLAALYSLRWDLSCKQFSLPLSSSILVCQPLGGTRQRGWWWSPPRKTLEESRLQQ